MEKIPTAEKILAKQGVFTSPVSGLETYLPSNVIDAMIEFAKLHVTAALKEALESIPCLGSSTDIPTYEEVENEVLNSYPLTNIK